MCFALIMLEIALEIFACLVLCAILKENSLKWIANEERSSCYE